MDKFIFLAILLCSSFSFAGDCGRISNGTDVVCQCGDTVHGRYYIREDLHCSTPYALKASSNRTHIKASKRSPVTIAGSGGIGILIEDTRNVRIDNIQLSGFQYGLDIRNSKKVKIEGVSVSSSQYGLRAAGTSRLWINGSQFTNNTHALWIKGIKDQSLTYIKNLHTSQNTGFELYVKDAKRLRIYRSEFGDITESETQGVHLENVPSARLVRNSFYQETHIVGDSPKASSNSDYFGGRLLFTENSSGYPHKVNILGAHFSSLNTCLELNNAHEATVRSSKFLYCPEKSLIMRGNNLPEGTVRATSKFENTYIAEGSSHLENASVSLVFDIKVKVTDTAGIVVPYPRVDIWKPSIPAIRVRTHGGDANGLIELGQHAGYSISSKNGPLASPWRFKVYKTGYATRYYDGILNKDLVLNAEIPYIGGGGSSSFPIGSPYGNIHGLGGLIRPSCTGNEAKVEETQIFSIASTSSGNAWKPISFNALNSGFDHAGTIFVATATYGYSSSRTLTIAGQAAEQVGSTVKIMCADDNTIGGFVRFWKLPTGSPASGNLSYSAAGNGGSASDFVFLQ